MKDDNQLEELVFAYLNAQDFEIIRKEGIRKEGYHKYVYFVYDKDDTHAQIMYHKTFVVISKELSDEINSYFNVPSGDNASVEIKNWIESKLNTKIDIWDVNIYGGMMGDAWLSVNED